MLRRTLQSALLLLIASTVQVTSSFAQSTIFTYEGHLNDGGLPANGTNYGMAFYVYDAATNGTALGNLGIPNIAVSNGLFTVPLDFGNVFDGSPRWLEVDVQKDSSPFTALWPRQSITSIPYAIQSLNAASANSVAAGNVIGTLALGQLPTAVVTNGGTNLNLSGTFTGNGANVTNVNANALNGLNTSNLWQSSGNNVASGQFLGSTNNQPVEIWVNNTRGLRVEPGIGVHGVGPNVIGGAPQNFAAPNIQGATISGGGAITFFGGASTNKVTADFGTVAGGFNNTSSGNQATVAGGHENQASGDSAAVSGGYLNNASAAVSAVAGGQYNVASGVAATVSGGQSNLASASTSFAAGYRAKAVHPGAFVWADSQNADFSSTANNQFGVRASGGARFITGGGGLTLDGQPVLTNNQSSVTLNGTFAGDGSGLYSLNAAQLSSGTIPNARLSGTYSSTLTLGSSGNTIAGNGSGLTSLTAGNISSGTLADARLSANVPLLNGNQTFGGRNSFNQGVGFGTTSSLEGNVNINTNTYIFSHSMYLRGETGTDHNHGLAYNGNTITNFGSGQYQVDGPALWGYAGGLLGTRAGTDHAALQWNSSSVTVNGDANISGNLSANNTPGVSWNQINSGAVAIGSTEVNLGSEGNYKPAAGVFVIMAYITGDFNGNQVTLTLYDVSSGAVFLTDAQQNPPSDGVYDTHGTISISWVVPISAGGGYQNFAITARTDSGTSWIWRHNLTVMYFPRQNN